MFSQLIKQCIQNSPYRINSFNINVRSLCQIRTQEQQIEKKNTIIKDKNTPKSKYLGYEIIYKFPFINYVSLYNKAKRNMLISSSIIIPTMYTLSETNIVSNELGMVISGFACALTIPLFITGVVFDNQIGIIYYKDEKTIKIAYVDIWGKRVDINTSIEDIKSLTDSPSKMTDKLYRTVHIASLKFPLKLIVTNSIVFNKNRLVSILGDYE